MILTIGEAKEFLRIDGTEEDALLQTLISAAEKSLYNATGNTFDSANELAKLYCLVLVSDWYENRELNEKVSEKVRFTVQSILTQLKHCYEPQEVTS